jgi:hypothetical protein
MGARSKLGGSLILMFLGAEANSMGIGLHLLMIEHNCQPLTPTNINTYHTFSAARTHLERV